MFTYSKVLNQVKSLTLADQLRLLDEVISAEEIAESEAAWQDYKAGRDRGISSQELKRKLFGEKH
ncbi:MAG: hypothetical protein EAZ25_11385 [Oscillatoriales cyanobacterium]|nr:MAG: hypothetical protein EAZ25_11385 [Oscillatoriales cyanobacterium]